jgi:hypothetical protein
MIEATPFDWHNNVVPETLQQQVLVSFERQVNHEVGHQTRDVPGEARAVEQQRHDSILFFFLLLHLFARSITHLLKHQSQSR